MDNETFMKQMSENQEGYRLALSSTADVLNKMNDRLEKQAEMERASELEKMEAVEKNQMKMEKENLIKEITKAVVTNSADSIAKAVIKQLIDLQSDSPVNAEKKWPLDKKDTDEAVVVKPRTATTEVQRPIQAMKKQMENDEEMEEKEGANEFPVPEEELPLEEMVNKDHMPGHDDEKMNEYPMEEDEFKDHPMMKLILSKLQGIESKMAGLEKQQVTISKSIDVAANKKYEDKMKRAGYRQEKPNGPSLITEKSLGAGDTTVPVVKAVSTSTPDEVTDQLSKMSWSDIWGLRIQKSMGDTEGMPKELMG